MIERLVCALSGQSEWCVRAEWGGSAAVRGRQETHRDQLYILQRLLLHVYLATTAFDYRMHGRDTHAHTVLEMVAQVVCAGCQEMAVHTHDESAALRQQHGVACPGRGYVW